MLQPDINNVKLAAGSLSSNADEVTLDTDAVASSASNGPLSIISKLVDSIDFTEMSECYNYKY